MPDNSPVEILFQFYSEILDEETEETLLAEVVNKEHGYFKLLEMPFYAPQIALGDVVWAEHSYTEGKLTYRKTVEFSGNSTIHAILMNDKYLIDEICNIFEDMACTSAQLNPKYFALNVPAGVNYLPIKRKLDELEKDNIIGYAESGLSDKHQYKNVLF